MNRGKVEDLLSVLFACAVAVFVGSLMGLTMLAWMLAMGFAS